MNINAAALFLGVSVRTLDNYKKAGRITPNKIPSDNSRDVLDYAETDLQKLKDELAGVKGKGEVILAETDAPALAETGLAKPDFARPQYDLSRQFAVAMMEAGVQLQGPIAQLEVAIREGFASAASVGPLPSVLTFKEAKQETGFSERDLRAAAKAGQLAVTVTEGRQKVFRSDLHRWVNERMAESKATSLTNPQQLD